MKNIKTISKYLILPLFLLTPMFILAQQTTPTPIIINIPNPTNVGSDLLSIINALLRNVVMPIAAVAVVIMIIWSGFTFLTAQGKPAEIQKAKSRLLWTLIGAGILLGATAISSAVQGTISNLLN